MVLMGQIRTINQDIRDVEDTAHFRDSLGHRQDVLEEEPAVDDNVQIEGSRPQHGKQAKHASGLVHRLAAADRDWQPGGEYFIGQIVDFPFCAAVRWPQVGRLTFWALDGTFQRE